jgi:hypothetical protein
MRSEQLRCRVDGEILMSGRKADELVDLITTSRAVLSSFAKAKTAKLGMASSYAHMESSC